MSLDLNSTSVEYKDNKVIIKSIPKNGENLSVFMRPGDEVVFDIEGFNPDELEYILVGGDIVVSFANDGVLTFPSLGLMGFSSNPPQFSFGGGKSISVDNILSKIEEINELPITSVDASFKVTTSNNNEDEVPLYNQEDKQEDKKEDKKEDNEASGTDQAQVVVVPQTQSFTDTQSKREDFSQTEQNSASSDFTSNQESVSISTPPPTYTNPYNQYTQPNDFNAYAPVVEMIPKPDVEMIPKPDEEMMPVPDEDMIPDNGFTDYFPDPGNGNGDGDGDGEGEGIPSFDFKATAHQVRFSEVTNDEGKPEILGGGGSVKGHKFDSITNQFEPETIDMSNRTEDMVIRAENSDYFSNIPSATTGTNTLTFQNLAEGQSVTVDGLTLTANGAISAADVAAGFASLAASKAAADMTAITNGTWSGNLSAGWKSGVATAGSVSFSSTDANSDISVFNTSSSGSTIVAAPTEVTVNSTDGVDATTTESHTLTFQNLAEGQSVTVDGLTLTANGAISAADVAAGFASLAASKAAADMTAVTNGTWSGNLSDGWSSGGVTGTADVIFTSETATTNVDDISVSSAGQTVAAPTDIVVVDSENTSETYLSRVLRFEPNMPEGFYVDSFTIEGLVSGVEILDKNGDIISTPENFSRDKMVFKDADGNVIAYDDPDFLTNFKSLEFTMKYDTSIEESFNLSITANYKIDPAFAHSVTDPEQSQTNEYTFALKDISSADDYTYKKSDFTGGLDHGFILSKEPNYNIIKDGSGNSTIYGGIVKDVVTDAAGDDTYYLSAGEDTLYGGSGTNRIYGDNDNGSVEAKKYEATDTVSYENVNSFGSSEIGLLTNPDGDDTTDDRVITPDDSKKLGGSYETLSETEFDGEGNPKVIENSIDTDMLTASKGVYVDLDGFHIDGLNIDVNGDGVIDANDKINAISKFANRDGRFTYDEDGKAITTTIGKTITFTSTSTNTEVEDILVTGNIAAVDAPTALHIAKTDGGDATTEINVITFQNLISGQSVTIDGLKLTATGDIAAADVAAGFASLASASTGNAVTNGTWSGVLSDKWSSDTVTNSKVSFTSKTATTDVTDIVTSSAGVEISTQQGGSDIDSRQTEKTTIVFKDLEDGQSVSIGGLTLTATNGDISAANVAAAFSELSAGVTVGKTVTNGVWSGTFGDFSSSKQESGLDSIQSTGYDIYEDIENIKGSSYNDTIYGNATEVNTLWGLGGSDTIDGRGGDNKLYGGAGYDTLYSGTGDDYIDGGGDIDKVNYQNSVNGVIVRLDKPNEEEEDDYAQSYDTPVLTYDGEGKLSGYTSGSGLLYKDTLVSIEDVTGSKYDDVIFGSGSTNYIEGMEGDDKIIAGGGYDFIDGGEGSDWISYYKQDYIDLNNIIPNGATNKDYMEEIDGITVTMGTDFVMLKETETGRLIDLIKDIEQVSGTKGRDFIWGDNSDETFWGYEGNDNLRGWNGNDKLYGGADDDFLLPGRGIDHSDGGDGVDFLHLYYDALKNKTQQWIRLSDEAGKVGTVQYATNPAHDNWTDGYDTSDGINTAINIEGLHGSSGDDHFIGNSKNNEFTAHNGHDEIHGMGGDDIIRGGNGDDKLYGGDGKDTIYGDGNDDIIDGGAGDDTIYGHSVHNWTQTNRDDIDGGNNTDGKSENDTVNYNSSGYGFVLDMSAVAVGGYSTVDFSASAGSHTNNKQKDGTGLKDIHVFDDKIKNIENIHGSRGGDHITGDANDNIINGWWGHDTIYGGAGNDTLYGGVNQDTIHGGDGDDYINLDQYSDTDTRIHRQHGDIAHGGDGDDTIVSQGGRDYLYGDAGNDKFIVKETPYAIHGGTGDNDRVELIGNTNFKSTDIKEVEELALDSYSTQFNFDQFFTNSTFSKIEGKNSSELTVSGTNSSETYDISGTDFTGFSGKANFDANSGDDIFNAIDDTNFADATGQINMNGQNGNDIFHVNYEALLSGKLIIDGGNQNDTVDVVTTKTNVALTFDDAAMFNNIETLALYNIDSTNDITIDAEAMRDWFNGGSFILDLHDQTQANNLTISNAATITGDGITGTTGNFTGFEIGKIYDITLDDGNLQMQVV